MRFPRPFAAALFAAALLASVAPSAHAAPVYAPPVPLVTVYNTPGVQFVGNRAWSTDCAMYSSSVVRCRTEIWATQVVRVGATYKKVNGWAFNNLSYLPSPRAAWASNNLGRTAAWTDASGRMWRTECDTPTTGMGGCRTYVKASVVVASGGGYRTEMRWVFNNLVLFSSASIRPVTAIPANILDRAVLTPTGFGPLQLGTPLSVMHGAYLAPGNLCSDFRASSAVRARGVDLMNYLDGTVGNLWTSSPTTKIGSSLGESKFRVGMTLAQLKDAFPGRITMVTRNGEGGPFLAASLREGARELLFYKAWDDNPDTMLPSDPIVTVRAREALADHYYGC